MKKYIYLVLLILWMILIFSFSSATADVSGSQSMSLTEKLIGFIGLDISENALNILETVIRKLAHFTEYSILGILSMLLALSSKPDSKQLWKYALFFCVFYAITDEVHQYFVPGRACRIYDICIDALGSASGICLVNLIKRRV